LPEFSYPKMKKIVFFVPILIIVTLTSCVPSKEVIYLQGIDNKDLAGSSVYEPVLKPDDVLYINVSSFDSEAVKPFNLGVTQEGGGGGGGQGLIIMRQTYLVNNDGDIEFPILGTVKVGGLTREEVTRKLQLRISEYVKDPIINLRIVNYKVSVLGEVNHPGTYTLNSDRITVLEAIAMAGDMTLFGKRENVLIIRENRGVKETFRLDLTNPDFIKSPYYYLTQNDVVYVEPHKRRINSTAIGPNILQGISILGFAISTILILTR
jgi:polysaccharide biosynthesis/export protein